MQIRAVLSLVVLVALSACSTGDQTEAACQQHDQARRSLVVFQFDEYVSRTTILKDLSQQSADDQLQSLGATIGDLALEWQSADYPSGELQTMTLEANLSYAERCRILGYPSVE